MYLKYKTESDGENRVPDLRRVIYLFISITPWDTFTRSGSTCGTSTSKKFVKKLFVFNTTMWKHHSSETTTQTC